MSASLASLLSRSLNGEPATSARRPLRRASRLLALEQRFMFDGAAVADAAHAAGDAAVLAQIAAVPAAVEVRAADPALDNGKKEAVLVDTSVADYKTLEAGIAAGLAIVEFDGSKDGLAQIARWAAGQSGYDAIHILSHGSEATLNLGTTVLTDSRLGDSLVQAELAELGHALKAGGDLLLYGCDLAAGSDGAKFLNDLSVATGADVAASTDATGSAAKNGDWLLEANSGSIDVSALAVADYQGLLAISATFDFESVVTGTTTATNTNAGSGETLQITAPTQPFDTSMNVMGDAITGSDSLFLNVDSQFTFSLASGKVFDLTSIQIRNYEVSNSITITIRTSKGDVVLTTLGNNSSGSNTQTFAPADAKLTGITSFQLISSTAFYAGVDNVVLSNIATPPTVTDAKIAITSTPSSGSTYKIGDTVTASWDNTASGDNNSIGVSTVTMDFSAFGGGSAVTATNSGGTWTASYIIASGSVEGTNKNVSVSVTNTEGGTKTTADSTNLTVDNKVPTVSNVTASSANGSYKENGQVSIQVTFSETVTVTGTPQLTLATGGTNRIVDYTSGSGSNTLVFTYTVQAGDTSADLDYLSTGALALNGGTIKDAAGNNATLTLASPGAAGSLGNNKAIVIDTTAPTITFGNFSLSNDSGAFNNDWVTNTSNQTVGATLSATLAAGDKVYGSLDGGTNWTDITNKVSGTTLSWNGVTLGGASSIKFKVTDAAGNDGTVASKDYVLDTTAPTNTIATASFSADTGTSGDLKTNTAAQTINGTLTANMVSGEMVYVSLNGGATWSTATTTVGQNDWTLSGVTLTGSNTLKVKVSDTAGNDGTIYSQAYELDTTAPTVSNVTASSADGSYKVGDTVTIQVTFSENVIVTGTPQLTLATGGTNRTVNYASGSGGSTLVFTYTVQAGDTSADLDYLSTSALALNGGTITDAVGNNATRTLASPGTAGSLGANKAIVIDGVVPIVSNVTASTANGSYKVGDTVSVQVTFSENVTVTGTPQLTLETGTTDRTVNYASGSGGSTLVFTYTVQAGDTSADLDYLSTAALALNGGTIKDAAGNNATLTLASPGAAGSLGANKAIVIDTTAPSAPTVVSQSIYSLTPTITGTATLGAGESLTVTVGGATYNVTPSGGNWSLNLGSATPASGALSLSYGSTYSVTATVTDTAGNATSDSSSSELVITNGPVPTTTVATALLSTDNGLSNSDFKTNTASQTISGTLSASLAAGEHVEVSYDNGATWSVTTNSTAVGATSWSTTTTLSGTDTFKARVTNAAGSSAAYSHSYALDTTSPAVTSVSVPANAAYRAGQNLDFTVNLSEAVYVDTTGGTPRIAMVVGSSTVYATYQSGSGTSTLVFRYTVQAGDTDSDGVTVGALSTNGGTLRDEAGNDLALTLNSVASTASVLVDTTAPTNTIATVTFSADTGLNGSDLITQTAGQTISGTLASNLASGEVVRISLDNGTTWTVANATVGQNTWNLTGQTLSGSNTLKVKVSDLAGNDGTVLSRAYSIDATAPAIASATVNGASLVLTYGEALASGVTPGAGEYTVKVGGATVTVTGVAYDAAAKTVTLTLGTAVTATDTVTVTYTADGTAAHEVQDVAGNRAANLTDRAVTNNTVAAPTQVPPPVPVVDATPPATLTPVPQPVTPSAPPVVITPPSFNSTIVLSPNPIGDNSLTGIVNGGTPVDNGKTPIVDTTPTLTRGGNSGFQVAVRRGTSVGDALVVNQPIREQTLAAAGRTEITVPADTFAHNNPNAAVRLSATQGNGMPLPPWVSFDAQKGKFVMQPPAGFKGDLVIKLTATDNAGRAVVTTFKVHAGGALERPGAALPPGRPGLSEQLRVAAGQGDVLAGLRLALGDHADTLRG